MIPAIIIGPLIAVLVVQQMFASRVMIVDVMYNPRINMGDKEDKPSWPQFGLWGRFV